MKLGFTDEEWDKKMAEIRANNKAFIKLQEGTDDEDRSDELREERDDEAREAERQYFERDPY